MFENTNIKIIDVHQHLGSCRVFDVNVSKEELLEITNKHGIDTCIVQLFPGVNEYQEKNNDIINLCKEYKNRFFGLIDINPHLQDDLFESEVNRLMDSGYFKAIKLHTIGHAINPLSRDADKVYKIARKYKIPVMIHTGAGIPFALPSLIIPKAVEYSDVIFIMAHSGNSQIYSAEAFVAASQCKNIYLETSWTSIGDKEWFINSIGSERVLFGSDMPGNIQVELFHYKSLNLSKKDLENILYNNAKKIFKI